MVTHISPDASHVRIMKKSGSGRCRQAILVSCMALALFAAPSLGWAGDSHKHRLINQQRIQDLKERVADLREKLRDHRHHQNNGGGTTGSLEALETRVKSLEDVIAATDLAALTATLQSLQSQLNDINNTKLANLTTRVEGLNTAVGDLNTKVTDGVVPDLKRYVEIRTNEMNGVRGPHLVFHHVNVHVQSGSNATADTTSGLGNLIIGYNEQASPEQVRLGAHNLVGGSQNGFSSYGGLVFGVANRITGTYASVLSGENNTSSGISSGILGGRGRSASWLNATSFQGAASPSAGF